MKRKRSFAAWISSFTFCCCCFNPVPVQVPVVEPVGIHQPPPKFVQEKPKKKTGGDTKVTRANFEIIRNGMTLAQVEAILGPGEEFGTKAGDERRTFLWRNMNLGPPPTITIIFRNDAVVTKHMAP